jgi:hypothetical protein
MKSPECLGIDNAALTQPEGDPLTDLLPSETLYSNLGPLLITQLEQEIFRTTMTAILVIKSIHTTRE